MHHQRGVGYMLYSGSLGCEVQSCELSSFLSFLTFSNLVYRPIAAVIVQSKELLKAAKALRTEFSRYKLLRDFLEGTPSLFLFIVALIPSSFFPRLSNS